MKAIWIFLACFFIPVFMVSIVGFLKFELKKIKQEEAEEKEKAIKELNMFKSMYNDAIIKIMPKRFLIEDITDDLSNVKYDLAEAFLKGTLSRVKDKQEDEVFEL